jgi:ribosomal protein S18 acetylase RimI-like enzyme
MKHRPATLADCPLLAELNFQLIRDEGHRNPITPRELEQRMSDWLENGEEVVAYALFREQPGEIYLRQLFVIPQHRRQGIGRQAMQILRSLIWPRDKRLTVEVLTSNQNAVTFWRAVGYVDYSLTLEILPQK